MRGILLRSINVVLVGERVSGAHSGAQGVVPLQIVVLEEHLPASLTVRKTLWLFEVCQVFVVC